MSIVNSFLYPFSSVYKSFGTHFFGSLFSIDTQLFLYPFLFLNFTFSGIRYQVIGSWVGIFREGGGYGKLGWPEVISRKIGVGRKKCRVSGSKIPGARLGGSRLKNRKNSIFFKNLLLLNIFIQF